MVTVLNMTSYWLLLLWCCFHNSVDNKTSVFADVRSAGGNKCSETQSCSGKCANVTDATPVGECRCDKACLLYGECCFDYFKHCLEMSDDHLEEEMRIYASEGTPSDTLPPHILAGGNLTPEIQNTCHHEMPWALTYGNVSDVLLNRACITCNWGYDMVAICPRLWADNETRDICENNMTSIYRPPVTDIEFNTISYRNVHCAICHGRRLDQLELWQSDLYCPRVGNLEMLIQDTVFLGDNCSVNFLQQRRTGVSNQKLAFARMCSFSSFRISLQIKFGFGTCSCYQSRIWTLRGDNTDKDVCGANVSEPQHTAIGVFVEWCCLYMDRPPKQFRPETGQRSKHPPSLSLLFSLDPRKGQQIVSMNKAVILNPPNGIMCGADEIYMFVLQRCQKIKCEQDYSIRNGECTRDSQMSTYVEDNCTAVVSLRVHAVVFHGPTKDSEVEKTLARFVRWIYREKESMVCTGDTFITQEKHDNTKVEMEGWEITLMHRLSLIKHKDSFITKNKSCPQIAKVETGTPDNSWSPDNADNSEIGDIDIESLGHRKTEIRRQLVWRSGSWRSILSLIDLFQCLAEDGTAIWVSNEDGSAIQFISLGLTNFDLHKDFGCSNVITFNNFTYRYRSKAKELFVRLHNFEKDFNVMDVGISEYYQFGHNITNQHHQSARICNSYMYNDNQSHKNCSHEVGLNPGDYTVDNNGVIIFVNDGNQYKATVYRNMSGTLYVCNQTEISRQNDDDHDWESILSYIGSGLSLASLFITILTYSLFRELRNIPGKVVMCLAVTVFIALLLFVSASWRIDLPSFCASLAMMLHYFWLSSFLLMNVLSFDIAKTFGTGKMLRGRDQSNPFLNYCLYAFGVPVVAITATLIEGYLTKADNEDGFHNYGAYGGTICWINSSVLLYVFYIPVALTLLGNIIMFIHTVIGIHTASKFSKIARNRSNDKTNIFLYMKLSLVMGLGWIILYISNRLQSHIISAIFSVANTFHGVFIFLTFICNARVYRMYKTFLTRQEPFQLEESRYGYFLGFGLGFKESCKRGENLAEIHCDMWL